VVLYSWWELFPPAHCLPIIGQCPPAQYEPVKFSNQKNINVLPVHSSISINDLDSFPYFVLFNKPFYRSQPVEILLLLGLPLVQGHLNTIQRFCCHSSRNWSPTCLSVLVSEHSRRKLAANKQQNNWWKNDLLLQSFIKKEGDCLI
jgi:hypothetical protein